MAIGLLSGSFLLATNWNHSSLGVLGTPPFPWCHTCSTNQHVTVNCPHQYTGPDFLAPPFAWYTLQYHDPTWYPDTGATYHMTGTAAALQNLAPYHGNNSVLLGNGDTVSIAQTDTIPLFLGSHSFLLRQAFHVPSLTKNLLSVAKFT